MKKLHRTAWLIAYAGLIMIAACQEEQGLSPKRQPDNSYDPEIRASNFVNSTTLDHLYFPMESGKTYIYGGATEEGPERLEVKRLPTARQVRGIDCAAVSEQVWLGGTLREVTEVWYARDNSGNVWRMGEKIDNYNASGALINHNGSWEAGTDGAKPGLAMLASPQPGQAYRQEYYFNIAENEAEVLETGLSVTTPMGTFGNCLKIKEWSALEPDALEYKFYAPGIGLAKAVNVVDNEELVLVEIRE